MAWNGGDALAPSRGRRRDGVLMAEHRRRVGVVEAAVVVGVRVRCGGGVQGVARRGGLDGGQGGGEGVLALVGRGEGAICACAVDAAEGAAVGSGGGGLAMAGLAVHRLRVGGEGGRATAIAVTLRFPLLHRARWEGAVAAVRVLVSSEGEMAVCAAGRRLLGRLEILARLRVGIVLECAIVCCALLVLRSGRVAILLAAALLLLLLVLEVGKVLDPLRERFPPRTICVGSVSLPPPSRQRPRSSPSSHNLCAGERGDLMDEAYLAAALRRPLQWPSSSVQLIAWIRFFAG